MLFKKDLNKYKPREAQTDAIDFIETTFLESPHVKNFLLNLPTGVGKSHLALMIIELYRKHVDKYARVDIITNSKLLQDQYSESYKSISDLKGKSNYECETYSCSCEQGSEFARLNKTKCETCPFQTSRENYISGGVSLTNFHLFILYSMYNKTIFENRGSKVLIVDEAHEADVVMSDFISVKITERLIKKLELKNNKIVLGQLKKVKTTEDYVDFIRHFLAEIKATLMIKDKDLTSQKRTPQRDKRSNVVASVMDETTEDLKTMSVITELKQMLTKLDNFIEEYDNDPDNWVMEKSKNEKTNQFEFSLEPIWSHEYLKKYLYDRYDKVFFMSGTILDRDMFSKLNGLDVKNTVYYSIDSPFPVENRRIIYMPLGKMSYTQKETTFKNYVPYISKILSKYSDKKGLIHTNSFELANWIKDSVKSNRLLFHDSSNKIEVFDYHCGSSEPTVIVSPSMDTGVSFDGDLARFQIVGKIPYPSLASQKNKMRQSQDPAWYSWMTCAKLIQALGRIVRSETDKGDTIILDASFGDIIRYNGKYIPEWILESIKRVDVRVK